MHVVVDADGEVRLGPFGGQLVEHAGDVGRRELLGRQAVAAADHARHAVRQRQIAHGGRFGEGGQHVEVERLADGARLLGAVEHGDRPGRRWQRREQGGRRERPVQPDGDEADLLAGRGHRLDGLGRRAGGRAHQHDHPFGVGRADVVDEPVTAAGARGELVEDLGDDAGHGVVVRVGGLPGLEEHVGVLGGAAQRRGVRRHAAQAVVDDVAVTDEGAEIAVVEQLDLVDLVAGAEPVEEVQERHARPQRRGVADEREVVGLLHRAGGQHRPAGGAGVHHIGVVTEDRQGVGGDGAGGDVDHARRQLAGDLEHVGHHQQQALAGRERRRQRTLLQRAVQRTGGARFGLHLDDVGREPPPVGAAGGGPVVGVLAHRRRRRDRIDRDHLAERVGHPGGGLVPVDARPLWRHVPSSRVVEAVGHDRGASSLHHIEPASPSGSPTRPTRGYATPIASSTLLVLGRPGALGGVAARCRVSLVPWTSSCRKR